MNENRFTPEFVLKALFLGDEKESKKFMEYFLSLVLKMPIKINKIVEVNRVPSIEGIGMMIQIIVEAENEGNEEELIAIHFPE